MEIKQRQIQPLSLSDTIYEIRGTILYITQTPMVDVVYA